MALFMIGRILINNQLVGVRLLDSEKGQTKDVPVEQIIQFVGSGKVKIENIQVIDNKIVGINGSIERYGVIGQTQSITILSAIKNGDKVEGFKVSDCNGVIKNFRVDDIIKLDEKGIKVANGRVCERDGKKYLSAINGEYEALDIREEAKKVNKEINEAKEARMKELVELLNKARRAYEQEDREIMSNYEYDKLYDELLELEKGLGYALPDSPTQNVGYEVVSGLQKERHTIPMLSLDKTKEVDRLKSFLGDRLGVLSWKLDGLTVVVTYRDGKLLKAVTRGNGEIGENVTHNAKQFKNLPKVIPNKGEVVVRGEAVIRYSVFNKINEMQPVDAKYKNPRNLCSGSVRQLDSSIAAERNIEFYAFNLVKCEGREFSTVVEAMNILREYGFDCIESATVDAKNMEKAIEYFKKRVELIDIPSDGLVLTFNDIKYGESLGKTGKFPRHSIAFKWQDEIAETRLIDIEWSCSRTGLINPVAIFEPVEIEGSTVSRASVHNVSIFRELELGVGDILQVYKANMIIPQIAENLTRSGTCRIPDECPVCGAETEIRIELSSGVETLYCTNEYCQAKGLRLFTHFVSRDAMNIEGLSISTLEKFMDAGFINEFADIYKLEQYRDEIINMEGFGVRSYEKLIASINKSRNVKLANLIYALGIPNIGLQTAKTLIKAAKYSLKTLIDMDIDDLMSISGIGEVIATSFYEWFHDVDNIQKFVELYKQLNIIPEVESTDNSLAGMTFCCTGAVYIFQSRNHLKEVIESKGGKLTGSVTKNTDYLITNDTTTGSRKNRAAQELGIPVLTEEEFIEKFGIEL